MSENVTTVNNVETSGEIKVMKEIDMKKATTRQRVVKILVQVLLYTFLIAMAIIVVFPFYFMIMSSLKSADVYYSITEPLLYIDLKPADPLINPEGRILWERLVFSNYVEAFDGSGLGRMFMNTVIVGIVSTLLSLVITVLSAFAFARLEFKGKDALFAALLATMMIPGELFTITNYVTVNQLKWLNTYQVLIVPFLVSVFYIYLLRQNFMQIPNELYLAAKVDGTSDIKYLWKVMIPLALPSLISITILKMMGAWNSYAWPNLVCRDETMQLITNGLRSAQFYVTNVLPDGTEIPIDGMVNYPVQMAAVTLVSLPLFLVFVFLRKYIMKGVSRSGIKG